MCFSRSNLELCSPNAWNYMKCFVAALSRTYWWVCCTMHNIFSSLCAWLVLIYIPTRISIIKLYTVFSHSNLELSRTHWWVHCTLQNTFSSLFARLVLISVLTRTVLNDMYEVLQNVPMACSPARWWVPTLRTHSSIDHVCTCNHFAMTFVQVAH